MEGLEASCSGSTGNAHGAHNDSGVVMTTSLVPSILRISHRPCHMVPGCATLWTCPMAAQQQDIIDDMPQHLPKFFVMCFILCCQDFLEHLSKLYAGLSEAFCDGCRQIPGCKARALIPTTACSLTAATSSLLVRPQRLELSTESPVLLLVYFLHAELVQ